MSIKFNYPIEPKTWFGVGGKVDVFFSPDNTDDLCCFIKDNEGPIFCLGAGSNVLIRDGGFRGSIIKLGSFFSKIDFKHNSENQLVVVGSACLNRNFVFHTLNACLTGAEFLIGIPGTIGGAIAMNAGAYNNEIKDILEWIDIVTIDGIIKRLRINEIEMSYRYCNLPKQSIVISAAFRLKSEAKNFIKSKIDDYIKKKEGSQIITGKTCGSAFKNPNIKNDINENIKDNFNDNANRCPKAWELIDKAGCRGLKMGDACFSEKHCNFLVNMGNASAKDLEQLGNTVINRVYDMFGIKLEWEIQILGEY